MASLRNRKINNLFEMDGIILKSPSKKEREELKTLISNNSALTQTELELKSPLEVVRWILINLSNIDNDELNMMTDEELELKLDEDMVMSDLKREIIKLAEWATEDLAFDLERQMKDFNSVLRAIDNNNNINELATKFNKVSKKNKLGITFEDLIKNANEIKILENKLKESK